VQRIDRRANRLPHDGVRVRGMSGRCRRVVRFFTVCVTQVRIASVVVGMGGAFGGAERDPVICLVARGTGVVGATGNVEPSASSPTIGGSPQDPNWPIGIREGLKVFDISEKEKAGCKRRASG
jgi:hypothetical protein